MSENNNKSSDNPLDALRSLLGGGEEAKRIEAIEERFENEQILAQDIAAVLAEAIEIRNKEDSKLGKTLAPTIEEALRSSITRNPQPLSDALFPVMGPAIRKSINNTITEMMQSLNQTLENSFSIQGLKWRLEAKRTGKTFAEVVMVNTLVYRVEQVFLIHKETGLLLHHVSHDPALTADADVVSSMLTAVQDFVRDSFASNTSQGIDNLRMGDLEVMIETSPDVVLAVICRGNPPRSFTNEVQETIEHIQQLYASELQAFEGDTEVFEKVSGNLEPLLVQDFKGNTKSSPVKAIVLLASIALFIAWWVGSSAIQGNQSQTAWNNYITQLQAEPGIVVGHVNIQGNQYTISGLRDPLSVDPYTLLSNHDLGTQTVSFHMQPYHSLQNEFVLKRAYKRLQPPESIKLSYQDNVLFIQGATKPNWLDNAVTKARYISGIHRVDSTQVSFIKPPTVHKTKPKPIPISRLISKPEVSFSSPEKKVLKRSLTDAEILKLAIALLKPPSSIQMSYSNGTLFVSGLSTKAWVEYANSNYSRIEQIRRLFVSNHSIKKENS
ncbi:MAG: OmpA family protein [Ghiorsea sp.]|nr:OmpA family protein [Ghiorsea sp.]